MTAVLVDTELPGLFPFWGCHIFHLNSPTAHRMATSRYIAHHRCIALPANAVSCITPTAAAIIAIPITTTIVATTEAPRHDRRSHVIAISCHQRFWRHRNAKQCHVEGVGQGPPLPLRGGGRVITVFIHCHMHTVLIKYNDIIYIFDVNGANRGGKHACCW